MSKARNETFKTINEMTELTAAEMSAVGGGKLINSRMEAQLNSRSVNPIVISRDRALNS